MANVDQKYDKATFKMEIDVSPLERLRFAFESHQSNKTPTTSKSFATLEEDLLQTEIPEEENWRNLASRLKIRMSDPRPTIPGRSLKDLYMAFFNDPKEWHRFVVTSKHVERKNKNELNVFSNLPTTPGGGADSEDVQRLTDYERLSTIAVLNELIDKLVILGVNKPKVAPQLNFHPAKVRYHAKIRKRLYDADTNSLISRSGGQREVCRFQKFRTLLERIVKIARDEIDERSTCDALRGYLSLEERRTLEDRAIHNNFQDSLNLIKTLKSVKSKNDKETLILVNKYERAKKILQKELQREMFRYGVYLSYFKDWAEAEFESEKWEKDQTYFKWIEKELKNWEQRCNTEMRVHRDVVMFLNLFTNKVEKDVQRWSAQYDRDVDEKDSEIAAVKQKRKDLHKKVAEMQGIFDKRQEEIRVYLKERAERQRKAAEEKRRTEAAVKIQSWWRGTMVRWEFGKYDPDKGKKKKGKGKMRGKK